MLGYNVRLLTQEDVVICRNIRLEALQADPYSFGSLYDDEVLMSDEDFKKTLRDMNIFGLFYNDQIVGSAGFQRFHLTKMRHSGELLGMYVSKHYNGPHNLDSKIG